MEGYPQLMVEVKADFNTSDEYQASYLISQAAQELCPALIWAAAKLGGALHRGPGVSNS